MTAHPIDPMVTRSDSLSESSPESHSGRCSSECVLPANTHPHCTHSRADSHSPSPKAEPLSVPEVLWHWNLSVVGGRGSGKKVGGGGEVEI